MERPILDTIPPLTESGDVRFLVLGEGFGFGDFESLVAEMEGISQ